MFADSGNRQREKFNRKNDQIFVDPDGGRNKERKRERKRQRQRERERERE